MRMICVLQVGWPSRTSMKSLLRVRRYAMTTMTQIIWRRVSVVAVRSSNMAAYWKKGYSCLHINAPNRHKIAGHRNSGNGKFDQGISGYTS
jgi:hypothetical protein